MTTHRIAVIPGDGIGSEVVPEGIRVLDAAARRFAIDLRYDDFDFASCDYYARHGQMMPDDWKEQIGGHDAIFFGAWAGRRRCRTTSPYGDRYCSFAGSSIST